MPYSYKLHPSLTHLPLEKLLVSGGDGRQILDSVSKLNQYGCSARPRQDTLALGSCSASSPRLKAWQAAEQMLRSLKTDLSNRDEDAVFADRYERVRDRLLAVLGLERAAAEICFSPSATDGEFLALWLATVGTERPICNIVVAPDEVGGGTPLAAGGCHFNRVAPWNAIGRRQGEPVAGFPHGRIELATVPVRDGRGQMRAIADIEAQTTALVERKIGAGYRVLLHAVEHSKTGIRAPSLGCVRSLLLQYGRDLVVVIDAAQGRIDRKRIAIYLQLGCLVLLSGSKFFGGPPFSGALLVPPIERFEPARHWTLPQGLADYITAFELPARWQAIGRSLPRRKNVGLLLRWASALYEMEEYYSHPWEIRQQVQQRFRSSLEALLADTPAIRLLAGATPHLTQWDYALGTQLEFERGASVFSFAFPAKRGRSAAGGLDITTLKYIHRWLHQANFPRSLATELGSSSSEILQHKFHLGQPVLLGKTGGDAGIPVLRVALGAALVNQLVLDTSLGSSLDDRLAGLDRQFDILRQKLEAIAWALQKYDKLAG